jgi:DNA-binding MarR family transcriptional regulator
VPARGNTIPDDDLLLLLVRTGKAVVDRLRAEAGAKGSTLTVVHGLAASYLVGRDDVTTVELARHLGITKQSASEVVNALEAAGTLRRAPHPTDRRARVLLLTDEGLAKLQANRLRRAAVEREWAELVGADRLEIVRDALEAYLVADARTRDASIA